MCNSSSYIKVNLEILFTTHIENFVDIPILPSVNQSFTRFQTKPVNN